MADAISVQDLVKDYGDKLAVNGLSFTVEQGSIVGFLGPNGAGKTTTIEILEGFRKRTSGEVEVLGVDPALASGSWRQNIGIVLQESEPEKELTCFETLQMYSNYYDESLDPREVLEIVGLSEKVDSRSKKLSGGQKRRLDFAIALIGDPQLIFLDEPTTGFDPNARKVAWEVIANLKALGKTVLLTTHYMDEASYLCDKLIIISNGVKAAEGTTTELANSSELDTTISWSDFGHYPRVDHEILNGRVIIATETPVASLNSVVSWAKRNSFEDSLNDIEVKSPTLEDLYLEITDASVTDEANGETLEDAKDGGSE